MPKLKINRLTDYFYYVLLLSFVTLPFYAAYKMATAPKDTGIYVATTEGISVRVYPEKTSYAVGEEAKFFIEATAVAQDLDVNSLILSVFIPKTLSYPTTANDNGVVKELSDSFLLELKQITPFRTTDWNQVQLTFLKNPGQTFKVLKTGTKLASFKVTANTAGSYEIKFRDIEPVNTIVDASAVELYNGVATGSTLVASAANPTPTPTVVVPTPTVVVPTPTPTVVVPTPTKVPTPTPTIVVTPGVTPTPAVYPTCTWVTPTEGQTFTAPANVTLKVNATITSGEALSVEFYRETGTSTLLSTDTTSPYQYTMSNLPAGSYSVSADSKVNNSNRGYGCSIRNFTVVAATPTPTPTVVVPTPTPTKVPTPTPTIAMATPTPTPTVVPSSVKGINLTVALEGRSNASSTKGNSLPSIFVGVWRDSTKTMLASTVTSSNNLGVVSNLSTLLNANGSTFTLQDTDLIVIKPESHLSKVYKVGDLSQSGANIVVPSATYTAGDVSLGTGSFDIVNAPDYVFSWSYYGSGQTYYPYFVDYTGDGKITIHDLTFFSKNVGVSGETINNSDLQRQIENLLRSSLYKVIPVN